MNILFKYKCNFNVYHSKNKQPVKCANKTLQLACMALRKKLSRHRQLVDI